ALAALALAPAARADGPRSPTVEFNRDIRPILSNNCFVCHGPDPKLRKAKLRLDVAADAFADRGDYSAIVPGKPEKSELNLRITHKNPQKRMPPATHAKQLTAREVGLLKSWIEQGAKWQGHWSLLAARRPALPAVAAKAWPANPIDYFILAR